MPNGDTRNKKNAVIIGDLHFLSPEHNVREVILSSWDAPKKTLGRQVYRDWIEDRPCAALEVYTPIEETEPIVKNGGSKSTDTPLDYLSYYFLNAEIADAFRQKFGGQLSLMGFSGHQDITVADAITNLGWFGAKVDIRLEESNHQDSYQRYERPLPFSLLREHDFYSWCENHCEGGWFEDTDIRYEGRKKTGILSTEHKTYCIVRVRAVWFSWPEERDAFMERFREKSWARFDEA